MMTTENTITPTIGITSTQNSRHFSARGVGGTSYCGAAEGSTLVQAQIRMPYITASTKPGMMPAISRSPTSVWPRVASSTVSAEGGMMTASPPTPMIGPIERYLL